MSGLLDIWRQAAAKWSEVYGQVTESQWERPTPCDEWTVRQLVDHTLSWQAEGGRLIGADTAPGDDWDRIRAAFDTPALGSLAAYGQRRRVRGDSEAGIDRVPDRRPTHS